MVHRGGMMNYLRLYANFLKNCFRRETLYRFNFWVSMFTVVLGYLSNVLFFDFIYGSGVEEISGWGKYEVFILLATVWIVDSIFGGMFFFNLIKIPMRVKNYDLDSVLIKPINTIFILTLRQFNFGLFAGVFFGVGLLIYSLYMGQFLLEIWNVFLYTVLIICSVVLLFSILFIMVTFSLRFVRIQGLIQMFWSMMDIGKQPHAIYPMKLKFCFVFFVPAIVIYNFPMQILLNNNYITGLDFLTNIMLMIILTVIFLCVAIFNFNKTLKYYYS